LDWLRRRDPARQARSIVAGLCKGIGGVVNEGFACGLGGRFRRRPLVCHITITLKALRMEARAAKALTWLHTSMRFLIASPFSIAVISVSPNFSAGR
jgi:hypothetical protein